MELTFEDGNAERIDTLGYAWSTVTQQSRESQSKLLEVQPVFRSDLVDGVAQFIQDVDQFEKDYREKYGALVIVCFVSVRQCQTSRFQVIAAFIACQRMKPLSEDSQSRPHGTLWKRVAIVNVLRTASIVA